MGGLENGRKVTSCCLDLFDLAHLSYLFNKI